MKLGIVAGFGLALAACNGSPTEAAPDNYTEADVSGSWVANKNVNGLPVEVDMQIKSDHSLTMVTKYGGQNPADPAMYIPVSIETATWSLSGGVFHFAKASCEYAMAPTFQMAKSDTCTAPVSRNVPVAISGKTWTYIHDANISFDFIKQ